MGRLVALVPLVSILFLVYCLLDVIRSEADEVRNLPKVTWVFVVLIVPVFGGVLWLLLGRPADQSPRTNRSASARRHPANGGRTRPQPPRGPDDDPEFLRRLEERLRRRDEDEGGTDTGGAEPAG